jgi:hypothetical protein
VVPYHNVTPELCWEYFVRLTLTISNQWGIYSCVDHNVTPKLCTEYFVRLILTNLDWVSTVVC